jgi:hypothetical protein
LWHFVQHWRNLWFLNEEVIYLLVVIYKYFMGNYVPWSI